MDKYEYQVHADEIKKLISEHRYAEAMIIADGIDWRKVRSVSMLQTVSEIYKINKKYEEAREILLLAYNRYPNRNIVYALCELAIKLNDVVQAKLLYEEFITIAPYDTDRYILLYKLYEALDVSMEERIELLEEFKQKDYTEKWAYELALLYHKVGQETKCVEACDELILWFGEGKYVRKAMELKMKHTRLSREQQLKYEGRQEPLSATDKFLHFNTNPSQMYDTDPQAGMLQQIPMTPYSRDYQQSQGSFNTTGGNMSYMQGQQGFERQTGMNTSNTSAPIQTAGLSGVMQGNTGEMNTPVTGQMQGMGIPTSGQDQGINYTAGNRTESGMRDTGVPAMNMAAEPGRTGMQRTTPMLTTSEIDKIEIKPVNVGMYNTIDLQNGLSENIKKFFESEQNKAAEKIDQKYNTRPFNTGSGAIVNTGSNTDPFREDAIRLTGSNGPVISLKSFSPADNELDEVPGKEEDVQITTFIPRYKEEIGGTTGSGLPVKESADKKYSETAVSDITEDEKTAKTAKAAGRYPAEDPLKTVKEDIDEKSPEPEDDTDPELKSIYEDWEKLKKENEERRVQEAKVLSLQQTADIMAKLKGVLPEIDDIAKPTPMRGVGTAAPYFTMPEVPEYTEEAQEEPEQEPVQPEEAPEEKSVYAQEDTPASYSGGEIDFARKDEREEEYPAAEELPEAEAQPDTQEEEYPETEEQPEPEAQPDIQEEEYPETEEQPEPETKADTQEEEYPEAEEQPDIREEEYPETEEQPEPEAQTDTQEEEYPETKEQPEAEAQADTQEEIYPETEEQPEAEAQADTQEEYPETEEQPEPEAQPDIQEEYPDTEGISDTEELPNVEELPRVEVRKEDFPKTEELPEIDVQEDYPEAEDISETDELPEIEPRKEGTHDTEELPGRIELPEADEQEDYPETEDIPEIETREEEYPEEETQDEVSPDNEAEETEQEEDYTVDQSPMQEIFYEPEMADDSWAEEEARGKTEEMPIREVTYELEAEAFDLKNIQSAEAEKKGSEAKDSDEMYFREIMSIEDPDDDEELIPEGMNGSDDGGEKVQKEDFDVTVELPEYPFEELDDYGEVEEMTMIEQPEGLDGIMKTDDMPVDALAKANYEAGLEFDYEEIDFHRTRRRTDREISKRRRPGYMTLDRSPESKRDFDEEEKLVFGRFQEIEWFKSKIVELLDTAGMEPGKGNVIITGSDPNGRKSLAVDIVKVMRATEVKFKGKVAKISGEALNKKDIPLTIKKLNQGALIVENAQDLTPSSVRLVAEALELESYPILVILEGDKEGLSEVMESSKEIMSRVFDSRIELQEYSTDDLVSYGKSYARELEYTIDDMGVLALYRRIGDLQTHDHNATLEEVCEIIDNAIKHVDKKNVSHFMDVLLAKRYDDNDYIILREKDFIQ